MLTLSKNKPDNNIKPWVYKILNLSSSTRNDVTYHYYGALKHLSNGYKLAFSKNHKENTEFALATELNNIDKDRSYYIDLSIQKYLENEINTKNLIKDTEEEFLELVSACHAVLNRLLSNYHNKLKN